MREISGLGLDESVGKGAQDKDDADGSVYLEKGLVNCGDGALSRQNMFIDKTRTDEGESGEINWTEPRQRSKKQKPGQGGGVEQGGDSECS